MPVQEDCGPWEALSCRVGYKTNAAQRNLTVALQDVCKLLDGTVSRCYFTAAHSHTYYFPKFLTVWITALQLLPAGTAYYIFPDMSIVISGNF